MLVRQSMLLKFFAPTEARYRAKETSRARDYHHPTDNIRLVFFSVDTSDASHHTAKLWRREKSIRVDCVSSDPEGSLDQLAGSCAPQS